MEKTASRRKRGNGTKTHNTEEAQSKKKCWGNTMRTIENENGPSERAKIKILISGKGERTSQKTKKKTERENKNETLDPVRGRHTGAVEGSQQAKKTGRYLTTNPREGPSQTSPTSLKDRQKRASTTLKQRREGRKRVPF